MLDIAPTSDRSTPTRMPLDFTPYLLSASPPNSCFEFHNFSHTPSTYDRFPPVSPSQFDSPEPQDVIKVHGTCSLRSRRNGPLKPIIIKSDSDGDLSGVASDSDSIPTSPCSPGKMRKRVSFADHCGKALAQVRIMAEASDEPPKIRPEVLSAITNGEQASISDNPPLKLTFPQPASDYLAFRDKLEKNRVSLENVILNDYTVQGTIKVKNTCFHKKVVVRYTTESWETHEDVVATYNPGPGDLPGRPAMYDTFIFKIEMPTDSDTSKPIEFAVCYDADGSQFWDSNDGNNYRIEWETYSPAQPSAPPLSTNNNNDTPFVFGPSSLADFACWHHMDGSTPYY